MSKWSEMLNEGMRVTQEMALNLQRVLMNSEQRRKRELAKEGIQEVAGYEFSIELEFGREAVWILENLQRRGCVYFQVDDGHHPELQQLKVAAEEGYFIFAQIDEHRYVVFEPDTCEITVEASEMVA